MFNHTLPRLILFHLAAHSFYTANVCFNINPARLTFILNFFSFFIYFEISILIIFFYIIFFRITEKKIISSFYLIIYTSIFSIIFFLIILIESKNFLSSSIILYYNFIEIKINLFNLIINIIFLVKIPIFFLHI